MSWRDRIVQPRVGAALIAAVGLLAYAGSFSGVFLLDDMKNIVGNDSIRDLHRLDEVLSHSRRPVVALTLALNYAAGGLEPAGYHGINLVVHILAGWTLFGLLRRALGLESLRTVREWVPPGLPLAAALIWTVHPLQTQSVTYVIQRGESLMGLLYLLTFYLVIRGFGSARPWPWYLGAMATCSLGAGTKAVMVTAPVLLLLFDRLFLGGSWGETLRRRWLLHLGMAASWLIFLPTRVARGVLLPPASAAGTVGFSCPTVSPWDYARSQPGVLLHYLRLSLWPRGLCLDHGWPVAEDLPAYGPHALLIGLLLLGTLWALFRKPWLGFLGAWFFGILLPTSSIIPIQDLLFEHRMYLSLVAVVLLVLVGGARLLESLAGREGAGPIQIGAVVLLTLGLGAATFQRNLDYRSEETIWRQAIALNPANPRPMVNLGVAIESEHPEEAKALFRQALRVRPGFTPAVAALGGALVGDGDQAEALRLLQQAVRQYPRDEKSHNNLGLALKKAGRQEEALRHFRRAIRLDPDYSRAHSNLGNLLVAMGQVEEGLASHRRALELAPDSEEIRHNYRSALGERPKAEDPLEAQRRVLRERPNDPRAQFQLGIALSRAGRTEEALVHLRLANELQPGWPPMIEIAWILATDPDDSIRSPAEAVELAEAARRVGPPDQIRILDVLAAAYASAGHFQEALANAESALAQAMSDPQGASIQEIRARLERYRQGRPYRR